MLPEVEQLGDQSIVVLHVDDDPSILDLCAEFLERLSEEIVVETETSATDALDRLEERDVDCVVSDYEMPELDGIEFLNRVREDYPNLPFILFTGKGSEAIASDAISAGVTDYLQKETGVSQYRVLANRITNSVEHARSRELKNVFQAAVQRAGHSIYITDTDGTIEYVNPAFEKTTGYSASEAIGQTPQILKSGVHDKEFYADLWGTIMSGKVWMSEVLNERKDGERYVADQTIAPIFDDDGAVERFVAVNQDITDRTERERQLRRFRQAVEYAGHAVFITDVDGTIEYVNPEFEAITGYDESEAIGQTPRILKSGEMPETYYENLWSSILDGNVWSEPIVNRRKSGELYYADQTIAPIVEDGSVQAFVAIQNDVTERKERQRELERQNEYLDEFATVVSHDLRNPLNVADGHLELAQKECDSDHLVTIEESHDRMYTLIEDLLTLARAGQLTCDVEPIDLADLADRCWKTVATESATLERPPDVAIRGDCSQLRQLLENLYRNAIEHGGSDVTVGVGVLDDEDGFYVEDDGPGIPPDERDQVFERGYTTADDGTGFGLRIVERIAEAHGWTVRLTESEDGGARFEIVGVTVSGGER